MNFEGSITPPLSDDENIEENFGCSPSPVLKLSKGKLELCNKKFKIRPKETKLSYLKEFYKAKLELMFIEKDLNNHHCTTSKLDESEENVSKFLKIIENYVSNSGNLLQTDEVLHMMDLLFALSTDVANAIDSHVYGLLQTLLLKSDSLHQCTENLNLSKWFHYFCDINSVLLMLVSKANNINQNVQSYKVFYSNGLPVLSNAELVHKTADRVLHDMASISANIFKSNCRLEAGNTSASTLQTVCPCSCFERKLFQNCLKSLACEELFWDAVTSVVNTCIQYSGNQSKGTNTFCNSPAIIFNDTQSALSFIWCWIKKMPHNINVLSCHNMINRLLRISLSNNATSDQQLANNLKCYYRVLMILFESLNGRDLKATEVSGFNLLWQNISQHLTTSVLKSSTKELSAKEWAAKCANLQTMFVANSLGSYDSFGVFLLVLNFMLSQNNGRVWLLLKDRFFLRFQSSTMKQLNEVGIERYFFVFMVVLESCPVQSADDNIKQFLSLLEHCQLSKFNSAKQKLLTRGLFAVLYVCFKRQISTELIAEKTGKSFDALVRTFSDKSLKQELRHQMFSNLVYYLNCFAELLRVCGSFSSTQVLLLSFNCFRLFLNEVDESSSTLIIEFVSEVVMCLRLLLQPPTPTEQSVLYKFSTSFIEAAISWLKKIVSSQKTHHLNQLCDVVSDIIIFLALLHSTPCHVGPIFSHIWSYFICEVHWDVTFCCKLLQNCLSSDQVIFLLNEDYKTSLINTSSMKSTSSLSDYSIRSWIKCAFLLSVSHSSTITLLTKKVGNLDAMKDVMHSLSGDESFTLFLENLSIKHRSAQNFLKKVHWTNKSNLWFGLALDAASRAIKDERYIPSIYLSLGLTLQYCSILLHTGKPSFVTRAVENFILRPPMSRNNQLFLHNIRDHMDKFLLGLLRIGRNNIHADEALKKIISAYLTKWPADSARGPHPFIVLLTQPHNDGEHVPMLLYLHDVLCVEFNTNKLAMVVEMLHSWTSTCFNVDVENLPDFVIPLTKIRPQLRFNKTLLDKVDSLIKSFNHC